MLRIIFKRIGWLCIIFSCICTPHLFAQVSTQLVIEDSATNTALTIRQDNFKNSYISNKKDFIGNKKKSAGVIKITGSGGVHLLYGDEDISGRTGLFLNHIGNIGIGTERPKTKLDVNGTTRTVVIEITGADLVEPFEINSDICEPGDVVVIDENNPGILEISSAVYDKKVAGVISGANGIQHGIMLGESFKSNNTFPVAMTGRVYVKCTTENGVIRPGDRLTTSNMPGHAMKATDDIRASGAVIGKAMSSLDYGTGLVLVLVNLQ